MNFVVLRHEMPDDADRSSHWDFMLEHDGVLWTWSLQNQPDTDDPQPAERLADHRIEYLDYEGPVSGDRGSVTQWASGTYEVVAWSPAEEVTVRLKGRRLTGLVMLTQSGSWRFQFVAED